ncbi:hypothetical protein SAMN05192549_102140 [Duganella sacchari]|uniref:Uncharacterized protein n=1 Tax=Duganella sacchari TaxID=551987 RepID=A0A1M7KJR2_9BURK|nr:hypothetical protein [Duganella sacchari]SHM65587.1 hypothetical protein SAMN05192549_102140 [Duganella sacchari]
MSQKMHEMLADAIAQHDAPLMGLASLLRHADAGEDLASIGQVLLQRAQAYPNDAHAYMDFSTVLHLTGEHEDALAVQAEAIMLQPHYTIPAARPQPGLTLLALMGPGDLEANTPVEFLLQDSDVKLELLYLRADEAFPEQVPAHDIMLVAVASTEANQPLLALLADYVSNWPRPVISRPEQIRMLSPDRAPVALSGLPGVAMPLAVRADCSALGRLAAAQLPVSVRPAKGDTRWYRIETPAQLAAYLAAAEGVEFFVASAAGDGAQALRRVVLIDGEPCVCDDMRRHRPALSSIQQRLNLPYLCVDCAELPGGELLVVDVSNAKGSFTDVQRKAFRDLLGRVAAQWTSISCSVAGASL